MQSPRTEFNQKVRILEIIRSFRSNNKTLD